MNGLETILTQNIAALAMAGVFIWYLDRKDRANKQTLDNFNQTLQNHLEHNLKAQNKLTKSLQCLTDCIKTLNGKKKP
jgi:type II secretory pathway pseudopilin PulG